ncbi:hypothetical protein D3C78_532720 [compost metagenome]
MRSRVHATNHDRFTVHHANLGIDLVLADRRYVVQGIDVIRLVLGHPDGHDHLVVRGDLRGHLQRQRGFAERYRGGAALAGFLVRHLGTLEDPGRFLVGRDHLGLRDDFAVAALFHGTELQVEQHVATQQAQADAAAHPLHPKVDEQVLARQRVFNVKRPTPAHPQAFFVIDVGLDDTRLDRHLAHRHIQLRHQLPQLGKAVGRLVHHQRVGALVDTKAAPTGEDAVIRQARQQQLRQFASLGVMDGQQLPTQRLQLRIQRLAHTGIDRLRGKLGRRRHQQHIALLTPGQALAAQHQVQRLVPWHILQAQGDATLHGIAGDQVDASIVSQHLQHRAHFHILEVQRQWFTLIRRRRRQRDRQQGCQHPFHQCFHRRPGPPCPGALRV